MGAGSMSERSHGFSPYRLAYEGSQAALMVALNGRGAGAESSVSLTRNAKGVVQIEVVARAQHIEHAENEASAIFNLLCERYPYPAEEPATAPADDLAPRRRGRKPVAT
jgi:hypothetical protein